MPKDPKVFIEFPYFITLTVVDWIDIFIREEYRRLIMDNLRFCQENKGLEIHSYCLMTSHLHMIVSSEKAPINEIIRDFKSYTAKMMLRTIEENPKESRRSWLGSRFQYLARIRASDCKQQFWERDNYPEAILTDESYRVKENYIHQNPVQAGFVALAEDWFCSSACPDGPLKVNRVF